MKRRFRPKIHVSRTSKEYKRKQRRKRMETGLAVYQHQKTKYDYVIGLDEVGWGAIAGPVVIGVAIFPSHLPNPGIKDSKRYTTDKARTKANDLVKSVALFTAVVEIDVNTLESMGPRLALSTGFQKAIELISIRFKNSLVVIDGVIGIPDISYAQMCLPAADALVPAVSAASIVAKHHRDELMRTLGQDYPEFELHKNKGYPTPHHVAHLNKYGKTNIHRSYIEIVKEAFDKKGVYGKKSST